MLNTGSIMAQTVLNFNISSTNEKLTPRTGIAIFGEYLKGLNFENLCNRHIPNSLHHKAYDPFEFIYPLILMLHSGGRVLDDIKEIRLDEALKTLLKIENIPTASAVTKYLHRHGSAGELGIHDINKSYLKRFLKSIKSEDLILDIDATFIEAHKHNTQYSYLGDPGYMPMIGHVNGGYVIHADFREGNEAPASKNLEFIKNCAAQLPIGTTFDRFRADSASYQAEIFNYCDKENILFSVSGQKDSSVIYEIENIKEDDWEVLNPKEQIAEFMHTMSEADNAFRVIVVKKDITPTLPGLDEYLSKETKEQLHKEMYYTVATNDFDLNAKEILILHRQRGETSENKIKELKNGFNMSYLPTSNFEANTFYFAIGTLAHNLFLLFKQILDKSLQHHTVKTIRYKLYHIAGKVISHARQITLKVNEQFVGLLQKIRIKAYEMSLE
jgi:hypothetical protein